MEMLAQLEYAALGAAIDPNNDGRVRVAAARLAEWSGGCCGSAGDGAKDARMDISRPVGRDFP